MPDDQPLDKPNSSPLPTLRESVIIRWLIGLCLILHALNALFTTPMLDLATGQAIIDPATGKPVMTGLLTAMGNFNVIEGINNNQFWRLITYQFLHGNIWHLGMNMMALYIFGPLIEKWWGARRFLAFYLLCGVCGAVPMALLVYAGVIPHEAWLVGASGALYGILIGAATLFPHQKVMLLIPPIPMTLRTMAIVFLVISFRSAIAGSNDGGNAAHLAGAALGFLLVKRPSMLNWADRMSASAIQDGYTKGRYEKKLKKEQATREEVDRILAKVSENGIQSLTKREKKILQQDTDRLNQ